MKLGLLEKFINGKKNTVLENIVICVVTALAGTFYFYEYFYGAVAHTVICLLITAAIGIIWLICSVVSGRDGKIAFLIFSFLYWSIPYVFILWYETRDNLHDYNKWLAMSNKVAKAILYNPFSKAADKMGTSPAILAFILLIVVMGAYVAGFLVKRGYDAKKAKDEDMGYDDYDGEYEIDEEPDDDEVPEEDEDPDYDDPDEDED